MSPERIAAAFVSACLAELEALKPGNVHRFAEGHGLRVADFAASARAAAPALARSGARLGRRILDAVAATRKAVGTNTNLGILLLCTPLAVAAERPDPLPEAVVAVLAATGPEDARDLYAAIRLAAPGGLGRVAEADVAEEPTVSLREAMRLAEERDRIAWNWTHGFADLFATGVPLLDELEARGWSEAWALSGLHLHFLARIPDSHVARKFGAGAARALAAEAAPFARRLLAAARPETLAGELLLFDAALKARGINPGTTADLVVASLFARRLLRLAAETK
ncbi:MAG: triphosphoribosyl-dephospho-CoA synthase [Geminicoccaceae bacterium]|nr:triphosphoribosyl-dephospho-CoA synthase [Geminicoccaceae bacterium]MDW8125389.1 triphosphoribosyl-dephospho-CoA synthase [Geminicoccaceae bacterium]MDW8341684.1 triphosphoribosyl-dephospho-CoA synthase [Geminicoccaceae bacterium]MDW8444071.1 triphosphoribosyl-dephospho-CoA synthase [Acetobacteraceae bacterium]